MTATDPFITPTDLAFTEDDQVAWATARIRAYCGWHIFPSVTATIVLPYNGSTFVLPTLKLTSITSVTTHVYDGAAVADTAIAADGLVANDFGTVTRQRYFTWPCGTGTATVVFVHGYDELPEVLRGVAVSIATRIPRQMTGATVQIAGGVQMRYGDAVAFDPDEQAVLDRYRLPQNA